MALSIFVAYIRGTCNYTQNTRSHIPGSFQDSNKKLHAVWKVTNPRRGISSDMRLSKDITIQLCAQITGTLKFLPTTEMKLYNRLRYPRSKNPQFANIKGTVQF